MSTFTPKDEHYAERVRDSFRRQTIMALLGARLTRVEPGEVEIELPFRDTLCQQHGFFHAGVESTIADSAGGYAGFSLFAPGSSVLTVEFKMNLLAPADGELLRAVGRVLKPGRTLTITEARVVVIKAGRAKTCAHMVQTLMCVQERADMPQAG